MRYLVYNVAREEWWLPYQKGYTSSWEEAGRYNLEAATALCVSSNFSNSEILEFMLPETALPLYVPV